MLRFKRLQSVFFTDITFTTKNKSKKGKQYCQVFTIDKVRIDVFPMKSQDEFDTTLHWFYEEVGVSINLIVDGFGAQKKSSVKRLSDKVGKTFKTLERASPWATRAELYVGLLKECVRKDIMESNYPMVL